MLTQEQFKAALPKQMQKNINQEVIDKVNDALRDPDTREMLQENLLGYSSVMQEGRFKMDQYINAVKYVSYKVMGGTNISAYIKTFPDKYQSFCTRGVKPKDIASYVTAYNKSKLVNLIYEQSLIPIHILNADKAQQAINTLAELMSDQDVCSRDRVAAATSLLTNLKQPEVTKVELDISAKDDSIIQGLKDITMGLAAQQKKLIESGAYSIKDISNQGLIIEGELDG